MQTSQLQDISIATLAAHFAAISTVRKLEPEGVHLAWLHFNLAEILQNSGDIQRAQAILLQMTETQIHVPGVDEGPSSFVNKLFKAVALHKLAHHYVKYCLDKTDEAKRLYRQIYDMSEDTDLEDESTWLICQASSGMALLSKTRGDLILATQYQRQCLAALIDDWGKESVDVLDAASDLSELLEMQSMLKEAEEVRNMYRVTDELERLCLG